MVTFVAVPFQLYQLTHSTLQVGLLSICDAVPLLVFAAIGGTIADRLDRRRLVLWSELGLTGVSGLLALNAFCRLPAGVGALRPRGGEYLALGARLAGTSRPHAGARAARPARRLAGAPVHLLEHGSDRRAGAGRAPDRSGRRRHDVCARRRHLRRLAPGRRADRACPTEGGGRARGARVAARGLAVPPPAAGDPRHVRARHERDGVRDAAGALSGDRRSPFQRRGEGRRRPLRGPSAGALACRARLGVGRARAPPGRRRRGRDHGLGRGDRRLRLRNGALGRRA